MLTYKLFPDNDAVRGIPENKQKNKWRVMAYTIVYAQNIQMLSGGVCQIRSVNHLFASVNLKC